MTAKENSALKASASATKEEKPRLLFFRSHDSIRSRGSLPSFIRLHLQQHIKCLSTFFDVFIISKGGDYKEICEQYEPDLTVVESGVYGGPPNIINRSACPEVPKLGLLNADAYCLSRSVFLSDMDHWGINTYFTISVSMPEYMPTVADRLFLWPNFIDPDLYYDYGQPKVIPVLITGSHAMHYPWRNRISKAITQHFPSLTCPHFGWFDDEKTSRMAYGDEYAKMINSSYVVPTCGTIAKEVVRKHFEIPGCNSCLITERTAALEAAGFVDMQNCVFATEADVLDKLDYLFRNRDVLMNITRAGYLLVQSQHTLRQRDQILQWLTLFKRLQSNQTIVQPQPFGPLAVVDAKSGLTNSHIWSGGVDRALLGKADTHLQRRNYDEAERYYLSCLNYHPMPEPILGLTLSSLYKGDAHRALEWISQPITWALERHNAIDPDPVEWAYFIISLLCTGNVKEATKRAHQFPSLRHPELNRCRWVVDTLNGSTCLNSEPKVDGSTTSRPSIHQLPKRDSADWVNELSKMLAACQQGRLAQQLHTIVCADVVQTTLRCYRDGASRTGGFLKAESRAVLPLIEEPFRAKILRHMPGSIRKKLTSFRSAIRRYDEFASAVQTWGRENEANSVVILGACNRSAYTNAFLDGIRKNPCMPTVFCIAGSSTHFRKLEKRFAKHPWVKFCSSSLDVAKSSAELRSFDMVLVDRYSMDEEGILEILRGAKTILISNINTSSAHKMMGELLSDGGYRVADETVSQFVRSAILTKTHRSDDVVSASWEPWVAGK
jgi:hypothetical protein